MPSQLDAHQFGVQLWVVARQGHGHGLDARVASLVAGPERHEPGAHQLVHHRGAEEAVGVDAERDAVALLLNSGEPLG
jgi:hypothetical protein